MNISHQRYSIDYNLYGPEGKTPIVFIHGFPFSQHMWQPQVEALQARYRLLTYDNRGHGRSSVGDGQYLLEFMVDDLMALLDKLKIVKAVFCGLSMGGYIALRTAERHPDRVEALVLCDTRSEADSNEAKLKRAAAIRTVKDKGLPDFTEGFLKSVFAKESFETNKPAVEHIRKIILANNPVGVSGTLLALASRTDTTAALAHFKRPTLIIVGEHDGVTPPAAAESMHKAIAGSQLEVIRGAGHMSNVENSADFNQALMVFLKRVLP